MNNHRYDELDEPGLLPSSELKQNTEKPFDSKVNDNAIDAMKNKDEKCTIDPDADKFCPSCFKAKPMVLVYTIVPLAVYAVLRGIHGELAIGHVFASIGFGLLVFITGLAMLGSFEVVLGYCKKNSEKTWMGALGMTAVLTFATVLISLTLIYFIPFINILACDASNLGGYVDTMFECTQLWIK